MIVRAIIFFVWAMAAVAERSDTPFVSTDGQGLGKWERININEERLQRLQRQVDNLQGEVRQLKEQLALLQKQTAQMPGGSKK